MNRMLRVAVSCVVVLSVVAPSRAQETKRFEKEIVHCQRTAEEGRDWIGLMEFNAKEAGDVAAADIVEAKKWAVGYVAAWEAAGKRFEEGNQEAGWKAWNEASGLYRDRDRWRERIAARVEQAKNAPTEQWAAKEREHVPAEAAKPFDALVEASKAVSEAWGRYAESLAPQSTEADVRVARQAINVAVSERDIAAARLNWARENRDLYADRAASKELDEWLTALEKVEAEIEQTRRQRVELDGKLESAEHARRAILDDARKAAEAARKLREEAERAKK